MRALRKSPGFALAAIATLALGIAASTAIFSILHSVVLAPLPYREPERVVVVWEVGRGRPPLAPGARVASAPGASMPVPSRASRPSRAPPATLSGRGRADVSLAGGARVARFLRAPRRLAAPRPRLPSRRGERPARRRSCVLGHDLWVSRFGADPRVLGRAVTLEGTPRTVVGVMPPAPYPAAALTVGRIGFAPGRPAVLRCRRLSSRGGRAGRPQLRPRASSAG